MASVFSKVFAITGGASGIGAATCRLLAQRGAEAICVGDIPPEKLSELKASMQLTYPLTDVRCTVLDVSSSGAVNEWVDSIMIQFGRLDGAANIAGMAQGAGIRRCPAILEEELSQRKRILLMRITRTPMLPKFAPTKISDEVEEAYTKEGFSIIEPEDVARTIVWLLSEDSRPVFGANINVGASMP